MMKFLLWFVTCLFSTFGFLYLFTKINDIDKLKRNSILIYFIGVFFSTIIQFYQIKTITTISFFIFYPFLFYSIKKTNLKKLIIYVLVIWLIGVFLDLTSMIVVSAICGTFNINMNDFYELILMGMTFYIFIIIIFLSNIDFFKKIINKFIDFLFNINYSNSALIIYSVLIFIIDVFMVFNLNKIKVDLLLFIVVILLFAILVLLFLFRMYKIENKKYLDTLKENNEFYIKLEDENRIFKHNLIAKLTSIKSVSNKKAISLIDDLVIKFNKNVNYSNNIKSVPYGLNGIIYQNTYPYLEDINFKTTNNINFDIFEVLKPRRYNVLVEKLVVCLNNAIEASINSQNKIVVINIDADDDYIYIEIKNTFSDDLNIDSLGNKSYSTKGKKRGLGLFSTLRNNEVTMKVKVINNYFVCTLIAKKQKNSILD